MDAETLIHEATFVKASDITRGGHSSVADALRVAQEANVDRLILTHFSPRYSLGKIKEAVSVAGMDRNAPKVVEAVLPDNKVHNFD